MLDECLKILKARKIIKKMAQGINPLNGEEIKDSFLNDPRIIRCLYFVADVLERSSKGNASSKIDRFSITKEEKESIQLPKEKIGVNAFAKYINQEIDLDRSKKLSGIDLNKQLKKLGLLSEEEMDDGKRRTIINEKSIYYGIELEHRNYNGKEYDMVVFNDQGKKFLLDCLEKIMSEDIEWINNDKTLL